MSQDPRFSEEEFFQIAGLPAFIGAAVSGASASGIIGTVKEAMANAKSMASGKKTYEDNPLIQALLPTVEDRTEAKELAKKFHTKATEKLEANDITSGDQLRDMMLSDCKEVTSLLSSKCTDKEQEEYKEWAITLAENVAKASKEGGFLGFGGERVSEAERRMIEDIKDAFGISSFA